MGWMGWVLVALCAAVGGLIVGTLLGFASGSYAAGQHLSRLLNEAGLRYDGGAIERAPEWHPAHPDYADTPEVA